MSILATLRYPDVLLYVRSRVEHELDARARRPSRVPVDELARLGALTFVDDVLQAAVDGLAQHAAGLEPTERAAGLDADLELDRRLTDAGFPAELLKPLAGYASACASQILRRVADVETREATGTEHRTAMHYAGVWRSGTAYHLGDCATHGGALWFAKRATDRRPGDGDDNGWTMMTKHPERR